MVLTDTALEIIAKHFQLNAADREGFIELMREMQAEMMIKAFFMWYDFNKSPLHKKVMTRTTAGLNENSQTRKDSEVKLMNIMRTELEENGEARKFVFKKMSSFVAELITSYAQVAGKEGVTEFLEEVFKYDNILALRNSLPNSVK